MSHSIHAPISPGELLDKLTILEIKQVHITDPEKLSNIQTEYNLLKQTQDQHVPTSDRLLSLYNSLKQVNQKLWTIEDDIRDCERKKEFSDTFIQLARSVYITNDQRASIKKEINILLGSILTEEKSYQDY